MRGAVLNSNFEPQQWNADWKELIVDLIPNLVSWGFSRLFER